MASSPKAAKAIAVNRKALRDYEVLESFEVGIQLQGTEVKSARAGKVTLTGGFARVENGVMTLRDVHISPYEFGNQFNHEPTRPRKLLLHKKESLALAARAEQEGLAIVPLKVYFKRQWVKVELGLCKGKRQGDKRQALKKKTADREADREVARRMR